jgi:hypothetical protein
MKTTRGSLLRIVLAAGAGAALVLGTFTPANAAVPKDFSFRNSLPGVASAIVKAGGQTYKINVTPTSKKQVNVRQSYVSGATGYASYKLTLTDPKRHVLLSGTGRNYQQAIYTMSRFLKNTAFPKFAPASWDTRGFWTSADRFNQGRSSFASKSQLLTYAKQAFKVSKAAAKTFWQREVRLATVADELQYWATKTYNEVSKMSDTAAVDYVNRDEQLTMPNYRGSVSIMGTSAKDWFVTVTDETDKQSYTFFISQHATFIDQL